MLRLVPDGSGGTAFHILKLAEDPSLYAYMEVATDPADGTVHPPSAWL